VPSVRRVRTRYLVELYLPTAELAAVAAAARGAADASVRIVEAISVPGDETCFLVVEAAGEKQVASLMALVGLHVNRISAAVTDP
jgi:hypothetical protein